MSEEVGRERLVHEGMPDGQKTQSVVSEGSDFEVVPSADSQKFLSFS